MKTGRINERNTGNVTNGSEPKQRKLRNTLLSEEHFALATGILKRVYDAMEYDSVVSDKGHLHPDAKFTDGGRITLCLTRKQFEQIADIINN